MTEFNIKTQERYQLINITDKIKEEVKKSNVKEGIAVIFVCHTTAGLLVTENESGLIQDWQNFFKRIVQGLEFKHNKIDNNADSHILGAILGESKTFLIENSQLVLGTWQNIFLAEFDGPRERKVIVKIIKE